jgi:hypothetical protein
MGKQCRAARPEHRRRLRTDHRQKPLKPARGNGRRLAGTMRARQHHFRRTHRHLEIMRRLADAALRRLKPDCGLHRARQERIFLAGLRPDAFVQTAHQHRVDVLQPGLERAPDEGAGMTAGARLDHPSGNQRIECADPFMSGHAQRRAAVAGFKQHGCKIDPGLVTPKSVQRSGFVDADPLQCVGGQRGKPADRDLVGDTRTGALDQQRGQRSQGSCGAGREISGLPGLIILDALQPPGRMALVAPGFARADQRFEILDVGRRRCRRARRSARQSRHGALPEDRKGQNGRADA